MSRWGTKCILIFTSRIIVAAEFKIGV